MMNTVHSTKQPLDSRQLRAFVALVKTGSFTQAGKRLFVSQSAVSHAMKGLENDIGCRLFDRLGKKTHLTQAGEHLLYHAEKVLYEMAKARESLEQLAKWGQSRLRLGASPTICQYILPAVLRELKKDSFQYVITVELGDTLELIEWLREGRIDLAVCLAPTRGEPVEFLPLFSDELMFLLSPEHSWSKQGKVIAEEISRQNFILYSKKSYTFRLIEGYFRRAGFSLNLFMELGSMEAIKELVKLGLGVSVLAPWMARTELAQKSLVALPLGKRKLKRSWGVLLNPEKRRGLAEETFIKLCLEATSTLGNPHRDQRGSGAIEPNTVLSSIGAA